MKTKNILLYLLSFSLLLFYIIFFPSGQLGLLSCLVSFFIILIICNPATLGFFFIFFTPIVLGIISRSLDIKGWGSILSIFIGLVFMYKSGFRLQLNLERKWKNPALWVLMVVISLGIFYLLGPQSEESLIKLVQSCFQFFFAIIAFSFMMNKKDVNHLHLGILYIVLSVAAYSAIFYASPEVKPSSFFETAAVRILSKKEDITILTDNVAVTACMGVVFLLSSLVSNLPSIKYYLIVLSSSVIGLLLLNSLGQRALLVIPILICFSLFFIKQKNKKILSLIIIIFMSIVIFKIMESFYLDNEFITSIINANSNNVSMNLNRDANWESALLRIKESPIIGHGLGGYYVDGYSIPGEGAYAHNIILELLSETGLVGTFLIIGLPIAFFISKYWQFLFFYRTASKDSIVPILLMFFIYFMMSRDLKISTIFLGGLACCWAYIPTWAKQNQPAIRR